MLFILLKLTAAMICSVGIIILSMNYIYIISIVLFYKPINAQLFSFGKSSILKLTFILVLPIKHILQLKNILYDYRKCFRYPNRSSSTARLNSTSLNHGSRDVYENMSLENGKHFNVMQLGSS